MSVTNVTTEDIQELRAELKQWEKDFARAYGGRKPTRNDIKSDASIAEKYKRFNSLVRTKEKRSPSYTTPRKRKDNLFQQRNVLAEQPINISNAQSIADVTETIASADCEDELIEPTPAHIRCALGPTPQKDGLVLGIFDIFSHSATPSRRATETVTLDQAISGTPSRVLTIPTSTAQHSRTPQSSSKRFYLDAFAGTPLKRKREDEAVVTPASYKRQFATPSFLRRDTGSEPIAEEHEVEANRGPAPARKVSRRKGMARSFSSILATLREQENERMDDEWDILRELEAEGDAERHSTPPPPATGTTVLIEDSQAVEMPLGPDDAPVSEEDESNELTGATRKPWKKKGLKRQTKKVNMKPVLHAPQKATLHEINEDDDEREGDAAAAKSTDPSGKDEGVIRKTVRKVNEAAHMNFRRLKIKSKNTQGKGRFGRR